MSTMKQDINRLQELVVDAADFFAYRSVDYSVPDFYGGSWGL